MNWNKVILERAGWQIEVGEEIVYATHEASGRIIKLESTKAFRGKFVGYAEYMAALETKFCKDLIHIVSEATKNGHL